MTNRNNLSYLILIFKCFRKIYDDPAHTKKDNLYTQKWFLIPLNTLHWQTLRTEKKHVYHRHQFRLLWLFLAT